MEQVLSGLQGTDMFVSLEDIVPYASSLAEHQSKFNKLAERLRKANLKLQPDKFEFLRKEVNYLRHIISKNGVKPDPKKIQAVKKFPRPRNSKNIKQFLGLAGYYRRFIPNFSKTAKPLTNLLKKDKKFAWTARQSLRAITRLAVFRTPFTIPRLYKAVHRNNRCIRLRNRKYIKSGYNRKRFARCIYFTLIQ
jgi:hypothetical protein